MSTEQECNHEGDWQLVDGPYDGVEQQQIWWCMTCGQIKVHGRLWSWNHHKPRTADHANATALDELRGRYGRLLDEMVRILKAVRKSEGEQLSHTEIADRAIGNAAALEVVKMLLLDVQAEIMVLTPAWQRIESFFQEHPELDPRPVVAIQEETD